VEGMVVGPSGRLVFFNLFLRFFFNENYSEEQNLFILKD